MKKIICLFVFILISFSYVNSQENSDLQNLEDIQNQILQSINDSNFQSNETTENSDILKILEENNKIIAEEQQKNIQFNCSLVVSHVSATMATANFRMCFLKNIKKKTQY